MKASSTLRALSLVIPLLGLIGCEKNFEVVAVPLPPAAPSVVANETPAPSPTVQPLAIKDVRTVSVEKKIDLLLVIDNSASMLDEQTVIRDSFASFIHDFQARNLDFHLGIVTTDNGYYAPSWQPTNAQFGYAGYVRPQPGCLLSRYAGEAFLSSGSAELETKFNANADVGTKGVQYEQGLSSALKTLAADRLDGCNRGFLRDDAFLSVIIFSDENESVSLDHSGDYWKGVWGTRNAVADAARLNEFVTALNRAKRGRMDRVRLDTFVNKWKLKRDLTQNGAPPLLDTLGQVQYDRDAAGNLQPEHPMFSSLYQQAVGTVRNGGRVEDLSVDFSHQLVSMGSNIAAQVDTRHTLSHRPVGPLTVTINGERVPEDAANGWTYDDANQQIVLSGQALNQNAAFTLEIEYFGQP